MEWLAAFGSALTKVGSTVASWFINKKTNETNRKNVEDTNKANKKINDENIDYQRAMTLKQWERDDTAHQREVADLEAAGLSPLASTSGLGNSQALGAPSPLSMQAPQMDSSAFINSMLQAAQLSETTRHNMVQEKQKNIELTLESKELVQKAKELNLENKKVEQTIQYQSDLIKNQTDQLNETVNARKEKDKREKLSYQSEQYWKEVQAQAGINVPYKDYYDLEGYEVNYKLWVTKFNNFVEKIGATSLSKSTSTSESTEGGVGALGIVNINGGGSESNASSNSENISKKQEAMLIAFYKENPVPVYHAHKWERY